MESIEKQNNFLHAGLEGIDCEAECLHTPDKLDYLGMDETNNGIVQYFECSCGKKVNELFTLSDRIVW